MVGTMAGYSRFLPILSGVDGNPECEQTLLHKKMSPFGSPRKAGSLRANFAAQNLEAGEL
jgi:hypothetical protein